MLASILAALALLQDPAIAPADTTLAVDSSAARASAAVASPALASSALASPALASPGVGDSAPALVLARPIPVALAPQAQPGVSRPKAVEMSKGYETRLKIHRWASYTMLPLFVGQYILGQQLIDNRQNAANGGEFEDESSTKDLHSLVAGGVAGLFVVNTVTGVWNLWESRHIAEGRGKRITHTVLMLAADAGFVATGLLAENAGEGEVNDANTHRNVALVSMGIATAGASLMWFWKD